MAVIKSNAYGHGLAEIAQACQRLADVDWVATAGDGEARAVRQAGCTKPLFILSYYDSSFSILRHLSNFHLPLYRKEQARDLQAKMINAPLHLKINTGTSRLGLKPQEVRAFCRWLKRACPRLRLEGVWSHFASAEARAWQFTRLQRQRLQQAVQEVRAAGFKPKHTHVDCSAPILRQTTSGMTMVRAGLALYGLWPSPATEQRSSYHLLRPVLTWKTSIINIATLQRGETIGYGAAYRCPRACRIATLPVGYWEGYRRAYAAGAVLIRGRRCPIRGHICMNLMMVDVSAVPSAQVGDEVVLIGRQGRRRTAAEDIASLGKTINYEVVTAINPLLERTWTHV